MGTGLGEAIFAQLGTFTYQNNTVYSWRSMARFLGGFFLFGPSDQTEVPHIPWVPPPNSPQSPVQFSARWARETRSLQSAPRNCREIVRMITLHLSAIIVWTMILRMCLRSGGVLGLGKGGGAIIHYSRSCASTTHTYLLCSKSYASHFS